MTLASIHLGPIQFEQPIWLLLIPIAGALAVWMARSSLSGLGTVTRRVALVVRLIVIALLAGGVARPHWRREAKNVTVTVILDASKSVPTNLQAQAEQYIQEASKKHEQGDLIARITVAREAFVQALPGRPEDTPDTQHVGATDATNLAEGGRLGMAVMPPDTANRLLIASDGNETQGSLLSLASAAKAAHVPVDVYLLRYSYDREVINDRLVAPATARMGQNVNLRVLVTATKPAVGRLNVTINGQPVDLDPTSDALGMYVKLEQGTNALVVPVTLPVAGPQQFDSIFEPLPDQNGVIGDSIIENNRSSAVTFVSGRGRVLVLASKPEEAGPLLHAMNEARIETVLKPPAKGPQSLIELGQYDAVVMVNTPAYDFSQQQQEDLKSYVHDVGGGLVMIGGPDAFGAGGWIGSPLADALPVKLDPPQKRQMPRGALVLVMHSCEMPNGNYWGKQTALAAVDALSRLDMAGVIEYNYGKGETWVHPLSEVGNKAAIHRAINSLIFGDAPSFQNFLTLAITDLEKVSAGQKHVIVISDGDPQPPSAQLIQRYVNAKVSISTVSVFPHGGLSLGSGMRTMALQTGGNYYDITQNNQLNSLPKIFIKEAQTVRRSLIWEGTAFSPAVTGIPIESMRGVRTVPPLTGYVVTAEREGLAEVLLRGQENDPVMAVWQFGLGRAIAFTSDATTRWDEAWVAWPQFRAFWEQHLRWAMRPSGSADVRVITEDLGDRTRVVVEALDPSGQRLSFLRWRGAVVGPDNTPQPIGLRQFGPGQYEAFFDSARAGSYMLNFRYIGPPPEGGDAKPVEGSIQAAVTRPFADEFRSLKDNSALLRQVATLTGGRVLDSDPRLANLWSRENLTMPVATHPIWLQFAIAGIGLFLMDVAVRRVRIDLIAIAHALRRGLKGSRAKAGQQLGSLQEARARARESMAQRGDGRAAEAKGSAGPIPVAGRPAAADKAAAKVKFEASADELAAARTNNALPTFEPGKPKAPPKPEGKDKAGAPAPDEGLSRLLKAKKRAQDDMSRE